MIYCQKCGAGNVEDARFCNMCGARIADAGEPGGPLPVEEAPVDPTLQGHGGESEEESSSAPQKKPQRGAGTMVGHGGPVGVAPPAGGTDEGEGEGEDHAGYDRIRDRPPPARRVDPSSASQGGFDPSTISLQAIGVRSRTSAYGTLIAVALALMGLGALGAWIAMGSDEEASEPEAPVTPPVVPPDEEVIVGDPVPEGPELPEVVTGTPQPAGRRGSGARSASRGQPSGARGRASGGGASAAGASGGAGGSAPSGSPSGSRGSGASGASGSGASGSGASGSGASGSGASGSGASGSGASGSGASGSGASGSEPNWDEMEAAEPRDIEMDMYANRVRGFIRQYYIARAQSCFDHESRNNDSVRGTVVVGFSIPANGQVQGARVVRNTTGSDSLGGCLARQVGGWRLPPPPEGEAPLAMQMPFSR